MATRSKPKPVQNLNPQPMNGRPAWHGGLLQFMDHVSDVADTRDGAEGVVLMAVGLMASMGNVRGDAYDLLRERSLQYARAAFADRAMVRALNAHPSPWDCKPDALKAVVQDAHVTRDACRSRLMASLLHVRPSLAMTGSDDAELHHELACLHDRVTGRDCGAPDVDAQDREHDHDALARSVNRD